MFELITKHTELGLVCFFIAFEIRVHTIVFYTLY